MPFLGSAPRTRFQTVLAWYSRTVSSMGVGGRRPVLFPETLTQDGDHGENNEPVDQLPSGINGPLDERDGDVGDVGESAKVCAGIEELVVQINGNEVPANARWRCGVFESANSVASVRSSKIRDHLNS